MSNQLPSVYTYVIDEVCEKVAATFAEMGVGQNVLAELRQTWKRKIAGMRVADFDFKEAFDDGYGPYDGAGAGAAYPGADIYTGGAQYAGSPVEGASSDAYRIPQNDGTGDEKRKKRAGKQRVLEVETEGKELTQEDIDRLVDQLWQQKHSIDSSAGSSKLSTGRTLGQVDGVDDDDDEDDEDDNEDGIGSDLDDEDSDDENVDVSHIILCQYEKVNRVKNKWKCTLKDGIITVNGRDYVFNKAQGDFEW
ncbi:transcription factor IIA, alpha/beta subunit-domain-containing protein [Phlyctochytrium arcticum]|nr:transcription factor IIA, alpha/beta subunit-domain-containing protein [Phlyctochytrium arcticum]